MKTIGFFGDSFCAGRESESWCVLLAEKLNAKIVHWGEPGKSIWTTFFKFNHRIKKNIVPDYNIFCWSEPYRLFHPNLILSANTQPLEGVDPNVYKALDDYWKYLHNYDKDEMAYEYSFNILRLQSCFGQSSQSRFTDHVFWLQIYEFTELGMTPTCNLWLHVKFR